MRLILASTSPARRAILDALGLAYDAVAPDYDEDHSLSRDPVALARTLALGKARAVAARRPGALVLAADQVCFFDGEIWGKPRDAADAREKLRRLAGRTHELVTAVALGERVEHDVARLTLFPLGDDEVDAYVATREWEGCAGGYRVEERGGALLSRIEGDFGTIRGLPLTLTVRMLRDAGVKFFA